MESYYSVSVLSGKLHVVGHHDHKLPLLHQSAYQLAQQFDPLSVLSPCRFVQDHGRGVHGDHGRGRYPFTLGHPKVVRLLLSYNFQAHEVHRSSDQMLRFLRTRAHVIRSKANLFLHRAPEELIVRVLEGQPHLSGELADPVLPRVLAQDQHAAPRRPQQAVEMLGKSRLAGAVLADDTDTSFVREHHDQDRADDHKHPEEDQQTVRHTLLPESDGSHFDERGLVAGVEKPLDEHDRYQERHGQNGSELRHPTWEPGHRRDAEQADGDERRSPGVRQQKNHHGEPHGYRQLGNWVSNLDLTGLFMQDAEYSHRRISLPST